MADLQPANHIFPDPNFIEDGVKELPQWLQGKENYSKLVRWYSSRWDTLDKEAVKLAYFRLLDNAGGVVLDNIGEKLGIQRYGQTDTEYKALIKLRAFRQTQGDTRPDIVGLMKILFFGENPTISKGYSGVFASEAGIKSNQFIEVVIPPNCLSDADVSNQLEDMFPINTNLWVCQTDATPFYLVDAKDGIQPTGTGGLSDLKEAGVESLLTNWIHSSGRPVKNT